MILFYYKSVLYILTLIIIILLAVLFTYSKNRIRNKELFQNVFKPLNTTQQATLSSILVDNDPELKAKTDKQFLDAKILNEITNIVGEDNLNCLKYTTLPECKNDDKCVYNKEKSKCLSKTGNINRLNELIRRVYDKYNLLHKQSESLEFQQKTLLRQTELNSECALKIKNRPADNEKTKKDKCEDKGICIYNTEQKCVYNTGENLNRENILISKFYRDKYRKSKEPLSIMPYLALHELIKPKKFDKEGEKDISLKLFYISIDGQKLKFIGSNIYISCDMDNIDNVCVDFRTGLTDTSDYGYRSINKENDFCDRDKDITECEDDTGFLYTLIKVETPEIYEKYYIGTGVNYVSLTKEELLVSTYPFYLIAPFNYPKQYVSLSVDETNLKKKIKIEYPKTYTTRSKQRFLLSNDRPFRHNDYNLLNNFKDYTNYCDNQQC